ncbi:MAG: Anaerobic sulfite reductase subunit A [bacterium ADurb.Bin429]|nr:MAG: Anaerobic sulfite reductase subunit A [bacterium ADurb.Bin429]
MTILPPKKFFQPLVETIMKFHVDGHYESVTSEEPFIIFGVHPYDVVAIAQMDEVFRANYADTHYLSRRERATIVACDIQNASPSMFAACMGTATVEDGFDILLTKIGDGYVVDVRTAKGEALLVALGDAPDADAGTLARREQFWDDARRFLNKYLLKCKPTDLPALLEDQYEHAIWEHNAGLCYSCGSCNMVCPTCYCFDVQDEVDWTLEKGTRVRKWDSCMLRDFATVAGGHNFRRRREERYRHRFYRKGQYLWQRMGQIACVGCGRCTTACTAKIANPVELYNTLMEG